MQVMTWGQLMMVIVGATVLYYGYVGARFFRKDIAVRFRKHGKAPVKWMREEPAPAESPRDTAAHGVHDLLEELKAVFTAATRDQLGRDQIDEAISARLQRYASLQHQYGDAISRHLVSEFSLRLDMTISVEEMNALWK